MDGVIQPIREFVANGEAFFDRFPDGVFDVVIATENDVQRYSVSPQATHKNSLIRRG